ncbi:MAG: hypothetical protein KDK36_01965 [Leptospiraceae bacterium]|nr:hypothetical protein [Leptospiraceae bacterium]
MKFYKLIFKLFLILLIASGSLFCTLLPEKKNPEKKNYLIIPDKTKFKKGLKKFDYIKVSKLKISSYYEDKGFVYKYSDVHFESDFYNEFLTFPVANFQEILNTWIVRTEIGELAPNIVPEEKLFHIGGHILSLYGDFSDSKNPKAILEFDIYVQKATDSTIIFKKTYSKSIKMKNSEPEQLVLGWNKAITDILLNFEKDVNKIKL